MTKRKDILRIYLEVPKSWVELSQEQLKYYYFVLTMCQSVAEQLYKRSTGPTRSRRDPSVWSASASTMH